MNRNDFIRIITDTASIDKNMVGEITEVLDLFPYFQSAHLLLLKGLYDNSDIKFENQLKLSALYTSDREVLYHLLQKEQPAGKDLTEMTAAEFDEPESLVDNQQVVIETGKNSQEMIAEIEKDIPGKVEEKNAEFSLDGIPRSLLITEESSREESVNMVFLLDDDEENQQEKIVYLDPSIIVPYKEGLLELDLSSDDISDSEKGLTRSGNEYTQEKVSRKQEQADLIDKFISANPRIEPVKDKSDHQAEDKSKPFIEEKESFITETLAKIYINQGYYSKAIDIYERLSLKFPEKSSYFAAQIGKVKELIKY